MKSIIPYKKEISFGTKIAEITSMSLEHEMDIKPGEISGNFIISGDYKSHEVSVNREPFLYKLPFSIELTDQIDLDTLQFDITDFSYDILNDDTIEVDIEFSLDAEEIIPDETLESESVSIEERSMLEKMEDPVVETDLTSLMDVQVAEVDHSDIQEIEQEPSEEENVKEEFEEKNDDCGDEAREMVGEIKTEVIEGKEDMKESEETIIQNVNPMDDSFATYHIHVVKEGENIETICTMYHSNLNLLSDYNDMSNIALGDKIIIPKEDE